MDTLTPILYVLMRTDLESMNCGKAIAQGNHCASAFHKHAESIFSEMKPSDGIDAHNMFETWKNETPQGFGTVLVLAVNEVQMRTAAEIAGQAGFVAGVVNDPTYPLRDGEVCHFLDIDTCAYVFGDKDDALLKAIVGNFKLHP